MNILMLDDEPEYTTYHCEALEDAGFSVTVKSNIDDAVNALQNGGTKFHLIIMDLLMPPGKSERNKVNIDLRQTGVKLHKTIRLELGLEETPIIIMSVVRDPAVLKQIMNFEQTYSNKIEFLKKPVRPAQLINAVRQFLG